MATTTTIQKDIRTLARKSKAGAVKKLSKTAEFWKKYPKGSFGIIVDRKAALK
jgi:hypothetical protein